jgi:hypothetical protein
MTAAAVKSVALRPTSTLMAISLNAKGVELGQAYAGIRRCRADCCSAAILVQGGKIAQDNYSYCYD